MKVLIQITHPAHVHFFRCFIKEVEKSNHEALVVANTREMVPDLLELYNIDYEIMSRRPKWTIRRQWVSTRGTYRAAKRFDPDVLTAVGGTAVAHVSKLVRGSSFIFYDTEHARLQNTITYPFADRIYTPECYQDEIGSNQIRYPGYQELAYLHPNRFTPDPAVRNKAGISENDRFVILRLVSWDAMHDVGDSGFDDISDVVSALEATGVRVLITSEAPLPESVEHCRITVSPHLIHHLMYYADLYIGESATMATESAVLGTPAVFVSSSRRGYTDELEEKYGLVFNYSEEDRQQRSLEKALSILQGYDAEMWCDRRERMLDEKIDTTEMMIREILETDQP